MSSLHFFGGDVVTDTDSVQLGEPQRGSPRCGT